jgi:tight adherence protein C
VSVGQFLAMWVTVSIASDVGTLLWIRAAERDTIGLVAAGVSAMAMAYGPWLVMRRRAAKRTRSIDRALPQVLDLIVTNIECGLGLQAAMMVVAEKFTGPIALEFARAMREIAVGVPRVDALDAMARRTGSTDVGGIARAIAQAERSGVSVGEILRARARELREHRRLLARELANKVPVKMTIPMVLFIFPTFFLLLLAPVAMNAAEIMG